MDLSVVIVNYNVKFFLEQCLHSVRKASQNLNIETFVVDNDSVDGSISLVNEKFPEVILIENKENVGFSKANNQAIRRARGKYVLLLNPDTVVQEDTFDKCFAYMEQHPEAGGLGVKMIDGKGNFLPESKRALPTPMVAFYKIFGFSALFPKSRIFGRYHLGYLEREEVNEIEVLAGAFMFMRKSVLDEVGYLDETYFMYGEDIDLSYRITKAGYKNIYFPETMIIHYKGESTKKGSINYVLTFYNAMLIFAKTHFSGANFKIFNILINLAIYFRAILSLIKRVINVTLLPVLDIGLIAAGYYLISHYWSEVQFGEPGLYPGYFIYIVIPVYLFIWFVAMYILGAYEKTVKPKNALKGILVGTLIILILYAILPEHYRFSRVLIFLGAVWAIIATQINRLIIYVLPVKSIKIKFSNLPRRIAIVGTLHEADRISKILDQSKININLIGRVSTGLDSKENSIGAIHQLRNIIRINNLEEVIFCSKDLTSQEIIRLMLDLSDTAVDFKIAPPESYSIIGSNSINTAGDLYSVNFNLISRGVNKRKKRVFDLFFAFTLLVLSPVLVFFYKKPFNFLKNIISILINNKSWVGYFNDDSVSNLPGMKQSVLNPVDSWYGENPESETIAKLNMLYAKDYSIQTDLNIIFRNFFKLDREV